jgi:hypothetical protein
MNRLFVAAARRGDRPMPGAFARLAGSPTVDADTPPAERLTRLLDEREAALKANDADGLAFVEHKLERWDEARAAQKDGMNRASLGSARDTRAKWQCRNSKEAPR